MSWEQQTPAYKGLIPCQILEVTQRYMSGQVPTIVFAFPRSVLFIRAKKKKIQTNKIVMLSICPFVFMTSYFLNVQLTAASASAAV